MTQERKIVLASKSIWRKKVLKQIGLKDFEIRESDYEEDMQAFDNPYKLVKFLALKKGEAVAKYYKDAIIISGDTFVVFENEFIGKPKSEEKAKETLRKLSGKEHKIVSGFAIIDTKNNKIINDYGEAKVRFRKLTDQEIDNYVATGESIQLAGAYGFGARGAILIEGIEGDYYSVVALPINKIYLGLKKMGVDVLKN